MIKSFARVVLLLVLSICYSYAMGANDNFASMFESMDGEHKKFFNENGVLKCNIHLTFYDSEVPPRNVVTYNLIAKSGVKIKPRAGLRVLEINSIGENYEVDFSYRNQYKHLPCETEIKLDAGDYLAGHCSVLVFGNKYRVRFTEEYIDAQQAMQKMGHKKLQLHNEG